MNKALQHPNTIKVRLRNQNKRRTPNATRSPIDPNWAPLLINWKRDNTKDKIFIELLLELGCVTWSEITWTCIWSYSICEPQGISNLAPSRSRLFKLIGRKGKYTWSCSKRLAYMVSNLFAKESEKRGQSASEKN